MRARIILDIACSVLGLAFVVYAAFNFNSLFFVQKMINQNNIPVYNSEVILPLLLGFVVLTDCSIIIGLNRKISLGAHLAANIVLLWGVYLLYKYLAVPILDVAPYQPVFYSIVTSVVLFSIGFIINDIPHTKPKQPTPPSQ